jgi:hypothetical protein
MGKGRTTHQTKQKHKNGDPIGGNNPSAQLILHRGTILCRWVTNCAILEGQQHIIGGDPICFQIGYHANSVIFF